MRAVLWFPIAAALLLLTACSSNSGQDSSAVDAAATLSRGNGGDPGSLDPALAEDSHAFNVLLDLYEGLLTFDAEGRVIPGVASDWNVSADGLVYQFVLRPDARWSNGQRVTAQHFVHGLQHVLRDDTDSPGAFLLSAIARCRAEGPGRLVIELERPAPWLPAVLAMPIASPRLPGLHDRAAAFTDPAAFVGNGPYRLEEWTPGGVLRLRRNGAFHASATVAIDAVQYLPLTNANAEYNMYRSGALDLTATIPPAEYPRLRAERGDELQVTPGLGLYYLAFDMTEPPLNELALRRALSLAIDRKRIVSLLGRGELPACRLVPPGVASQADWKAEWCEWSAPEREREARVALAASKRDVGETLPIRLTYDSGDVHETIALALRSMWQEVLGLRVELRQLEWKAFLDLRDERGAWEIMRFVWVGDYDDASAFTDLFVSGSTLNLPGYASPRYDDLVRRASGSVDPAKRGQLLAAAERALLDDHAIAPLYFMTNKHLVSPRVDGYRQNALDRHPSRFLRLRGIYQ